MEVKKACVFSIMRQLVKESRKRGEVYQSVVVYDGVHLIRKSHWPSTFINWAVKLGSFSIDNIFL